MPSRKRQCPRQARLHRHCLDSLEIPFSHRCIFPPPPVCQVPPHFCQVSPPTCQTQSRSCQVTSPACQIRPLDCPDTDIFSQVPPTACQVEPSSCQVEYPICQIGPPACAAFKSRLCQVSTPNPVRYPVSQDKPPTYQVPAPSGLLKPIGCQVDPPGSLLQSPVCQFLPPNRQNQTPSAMKHPIWDQDFCTADTCRDSKKCRTCSQLPTPFCQNSADEEDILMHSDCLGHCTQSEGGCENVEENNFDSPNSSHRSSNNQQDNSREDDEYNQIPIPYSNTPSRTNQNANITPNYRNDEENTAQTQNIPHKECVESCQNQYFSDAAGSAHRETIPNSDNLNNNSTKTNFRSTGSFSDYQGYHVRNKMPNDLNDSQKPRSSQDIDDIPVSKENFPQISDNADNSTIWQTIPCCRPGYFQEQALQPNSLGNENYFQTRQEFNSEQSSSKADNTICQNCCDTDDEMSTYPTKPYTDNINNDENFKQSSSYDAEDIGARIEASSCPRSALKSLSNMRSRSGAKVHMQEHSDGTCMDCSTCCSISDSNNKVNNPHENNSPDYGNGSELQSEHAKSQTRFANQSGQSKFENSVPIKGRKQFANCCKRGISKALEPPELPANVSKAECGKKEACVQEVGASSCASTTCVANNRDSVCVCRYPPAFKQFSCAGNINGTCSCSDKSK